MMILPETPRFHIKKGKHEAAAKALARLRRLPVDHPGLIEELSEVRANRELHTIPSCLHNSTFNPTVPEHQAKLTESSDEYEMAVGKGTYADCFKGTVGKRLMTGCFLQALQQLSGESRASRYGQRV